MISSQVLKTGASRPFSATVLVLKHRRTLKYLWKRDRKSFWNHLFVSYFIRGEDCGRGVLDPVWKLAGNAPFLWDLEIEITTKCYLRCIMCEHTHWKNKRYANQDMSFADFKNLIDSIPNLKWINITGEGSPFLNPDFILMVEYCKSKGIYVDFCYDFYKLSQGDMRRLIMAGVDRIYWSVDAVYKDTYEAIRVGADFDEVKANVRKLVELKEEYKSPLPEICFRFCFMQNNLSELFFLPDFLNALVDGDIKKYGDDPSLNIVGLLEFEETENQVVEISDHYKKLVDDNCKSVGITTYWSHVSHIEEKKAPLEYCTFWSEPYIMITGHVVPDCAVLMSNSREKLEWLSFGNIHENTLKEIWNTKDYKNFRKMVVNSKAPVPDICAGCRVFNTQTRALKYGIFQRK